MSKAIMTLSLLCVLFVACGEKKVVIKNDPVLNEKLVSAVQEKNLKAAEKLLRKGADPNAAFGGGRNTVFHLALYVNDAKTIRLLMESGADILKPDQNNYSPLSLAARVNNADIVSLLLGKGTDVNAVNNNSIRSTALMDAAEANAIDAMKLLISKGADVDILDKWHAPAITIAADKNNMEAVELLAEAGAELNVIDSGRGFTALDFAIRNKNDKMVAYLESKGAKPNLYK